MSALPLALLLLLASAEPQEPDRIDPDQARVDAAAQSPESLWAFLIDPETRYDDRLAAAVKANEVLPPQYIPKLAAAQFELSERGVRRDPDSETLADQRRAPWQWQLDRALQRIEIERGSTPGIDVVRDLPCTTASEEMVILLTLKRFPMTAESYGVVRNLLTPRPGLFLEPGLPDWWLQRWEDDRYAAQAFIADLAPRNETSGAFAMTEILDTSSRFLYDLIEMLKELRGGARDPFPYTAFLALARRIDDDFDQVEDACRMVHDAHRLIQVHDQITKEPAVTREDGCRAAVADFRQWLRDHRAELETGAAAEQPSIANARARMNQVSLCRR